MVSRDVTNKVQQNQFGGGRASQHHPRVRREEAGGCRPLFEINEPAGGLGIRRDTEYLFNPVPVPAALTR